MSYQALPVSLSPLQRPSQELPTCWIKSKWWNSKEETEQVHPDTGEAMAKFHVSIYAIYNSSRCSLKSTMSSPVSCLWSIPSEKPDRPGLYLECLDFQSFSSKHGSVGASGFWPHPGTCVQPGKSDLHQAGQLRRHLQHPLHLPLCDSSSSWM